MTEIKRKEYSSSRTEALADHKSYEPDTHVSIPSEEAVEEAKAWAEGNEL